MYASARLGYGNSLYPVHSALELKTAVRTVSFNLEHDLLIASELGIVIVDNTDRESSSRGITLIHLVDRGSTKRSFFSARARSYLHDDRPVVTRVSFLKHQD